MILRVMGLLISLGHISALSLLPQNAFVRPNSRSNSAFTSSIASHVLEASQLDQKMQVTHTFRALLASSEFKNDFWQKKPLHLQESMPNIKLAYTIRDVEDSVENDFVEAGRGTLEGGQGGWNMAAVSTPRGSSFEDAKLRFSDVQVAMSKTSGTVVFNSAGGFIPPLAGVCMQTMDAIDMPVAINMYLTEPGQRLSAPPHTDKQDVIVLQTQGRKHWRVFPPPPPSLQPKADPYTRGKAKDVLKMEELGPPLLDAVLEPGQLLYVPGGYPHTTDTLPEHCGKEEDDDDDDGSDPSVHLTVGIDTHIWGLTYASLRSYALRRKGLREKLELSRIDPAAFFALQEVLPFGTFSSAIVGVNPDLMGFGSGMQEAIHVEIKARLLEKMLATEPGRWTSAGALDTDIGSQVDETIVRLLKHHASVVDTMKSMYRDVALKLSPSKMDISFFRSQPYFEQLEILMGGLEAWSEHGDDGGGGGGGGVSLTKSGGPVSDLAAAKGVKKKKKNKKKENEKGKSSSTGGFGK